MLALFALARAEGGPVQAPTLPTRMAGRGGQNRTPFVWVGRDDRSVTFVNETHDYPQRIRYWREGRELVAEIALKEGSKAVSWRYKSARD